MSAERRSAWAVFAAWVVVACAPAMGQGANTPTCNPLALSTAAARLDLVGSYRTLVESRHGRTVDLYESVVDNSPVRARSIRIDAAHGSIRVVIIGDRAWLAEPGQGFQAVDPKAAAVVATGGDVAHVIRLYDSDPVRSALQLVGTETRNGTTARRYEAGAKALVAGFPDAAGDALLRIWVTSDCRLVALEARGVEGSDSELRLEVTHLDDPANSVAPPR